MAKLADSVQESLASYGVRDCSICVALSGGVDSVVLLDVLLGLADVNTLQVSAFHVHHGISRYADQWEAFCRSLCTASGVAFASVRVIVPRDTGEGPEAAARRLRYRALAGADADYVALGHHLDDQVETFLLQLLRGAGPLGLSAMPMVGRTKDEDGGMADEGAGRARLLRPLLGVTRAEIEQHARLRKLEWVEDESNRNLDLDRNFLRHRVLPVIAARFPAYRETLSRAARNLADAATALETLAASDLEAVSADGGVSCPRLKALSPERALNVLRLLIARSGGRMPPRAHLEEALRQCLEAGEDAQPQMDFGAFRLRRYRDVLRLMPEQSAPGDWSMRWEGEATLPLPDGLGRLRFAPATGQGVAVSRLKAAVTVRFRRGGERFDPDATRPRRALKKLLQESAVPAWERSRLPLVFAGDELVWVPGLGIAAGYRAASGEPGIEIEWEADRQPC